MSYTTSIVLTRAWIIDPADPSDRPIVCGTVRPSDWTMAKDGGVRQMAGGRRQGSTGPSKLRTETVVLVGLGYAQMLQVINDWIGKPLLFRSRIGERFYCVFYGASGHNIDRASLNDGRAFSMTIDMYEIDYDETPA